LIVSSRHSYLQDADDYYQIESVSNSYATGGIYGLDQEKCSEKLLPQSSSDFTFAIIVEEYGLTGAMGISRIYLLLLFDSLLQLINPQPIRANQLSSDLVFQQFFKQ
jgi:cell division protein FtsW (lipid II flippase)